MKKPFTNAVFSPAEFPGRTNLPQTKLGQTEKRKPGGSFRACLFMVSIGILFSGCTEDHKPGLDQELTRLHDAVSIYSDLKKAKANGYDTDVTGYRTQMGHHYLNASLLDDKFEIEKPELLLYAPYGKDSMAFVAVEYATPIKDINNPPAVPEGFTGKDDKWEINTEFNLWTLHVWIELENEHGLFAPHNPKLP